jgi:hypothetical protein
MVLDLKEREKKANEKRGKRRKKTSKVRKKKKETFYCGKNSPNIKGRKRRKKILSGKKNSYPVAKEPTQAGNVNIVCRVITLLMEGRRE